MTAGGFFIENISVDICICANVLYIGEVIRTQTARIMTPDKRAQAIAIIADNVGSPVKVQFGYCASENSVIQHDAICLVESHAGLIKRLTNEGYSLYLRNGLLLIDHHGV